MARRRGAVWTALNRDDFGARLASWIGRHRSGIILACGAVLRLVAYLADRPMWLDEASLADNILGRTLAEVLGPLRNTQLAPAGFLAVEWLATQVLGPSTLALRLFPCAAGIASLFLFYLVARRCVDPDAVPIALALFAVAGDLIYFASEVKPYGPDVAVALACTLMGLEVMAGPATMGRFAALGAVGAAAVWISFPAAFVVAGVGIVLMASALAAQDRRRAWLLVPVGLAWTVSFAGVYLFSRRQLGPGGGMWDFWAFAFPPLPPRSVRDATWVPRRLLYLFANPLDFRTPLGPRLSALPAAVLCVVGGIALGRTRREAGAMLALPGVLTLLAAFPRLYPFHGRLLLFLVPALLLFIAEGAERVRRRSRSRVVGVALLAILLLFPTVRALDRVLNPRANRDFHPIGDLRPPGLTPDRFPF